MLLLLVVASVSFTSCKKEGCTDAAATNYDSNADKDDGSCTFPVVIACISDAHNGTYTGSGTVNSIPNTDMTLVFTKLSCTTCTIESGGVTESVTNLEVAASGGYNGIDGNGNSISFTLTGLNLTVQSDEISFDGAQ